MKRNHQPEEVFVELKKIVSGRPLVFLGVGSEFHGDDSWPFLLIKKINQLKKEHVHAIWAETVPENFIAPVTRITPENVIICDSADMNVLPGTFRIFDSAEVAEQPVAFTHRMPLTTLASMISEKCRCKVTLLLMQPKNIDFSKQLTKEVKASLQVLTKSIKDLLK